MKQRKCIYCGKSFQPSPYHPNQRVCSRKICRRKRDRDYHHRKLLTDETYRTTCRESKKHWRERNPDYHREYRKNHPSLVAQNRHLQRKRDRRRKHRQTVAQLHDCFTEPNQSPICVMSFQKKNLDKNMLAFPEVIVFKGISETVFDQNLDKNSLAFSPHG